jgi:hypothetical protein
MTSKSICQCFSAAVFFVAIETKRNLLVRPNITVKSVLSGSQKPIVEYGTMQIWIPKDLLTTVQNPERRVSTADSTIAVTASRRDSNDPSRNSSTYRSALGNISPSIRESTMGSETALSHTIPKKPLLVLFLKSRSSSEVNYALVAVEIDTETFINRGRCHAKKPRIVPLVV